jgi:Flp pilus assembly protein protease CpaA
MIYFEAFLIAIIFTEGYFCSYTDLKFGKIKNIAICVGLFAGFVVNCIYYNFYVFNYFFEYLFNLIIAVFIAVLFYAFHIWAGGDSKLFILFQFLYPARLFTGSNKMPTAIKVVIYVFSIAFIYLTIESIILTVKKGYEQNIVLNFGNIKSFIINYTITSSYILGFHFILYLLASKIYITYINIIIFTNIFIIMIIQKFKIFKKIYLFFPFACIGILQIIYTNIKGFFNINIKSLIIVLAVFIMRMLSDRYNYKEIPTKDVITGMLISYRTVLTFMNSKIQGLPQTTTEDIKSRITAEEAESIRKWEKSKYGIQTIWILRKIPFAIFITIGMILYLLIGVITC